MPETQEIFIPTSELAYHLQQEFFEDLKTKSRADIEVEILRWLIDNKYKIVKNQ